MRHLSLAVTRVRGAASGGGAGKGHRAATSRISHAALGGFHVVPRSSLWNVRLTDSREHPVGSHEASPPTTPPRTLPAAVPYAKLAPVTASTPSPRWNSDVHVCPGPHRAKTGRHDAWHTDSGDAEASHEYAHFAALAASASDAKSARRSDEEARMVVSRGRGTTARASNARGYFEEAPCVVLTVKSAVVPLLGFEMDLLVGSSPRLPTPTRAVGTVDARGVPRPSRRRPPPRAPRVRAPRRSRLDPARVRLAFAEEGAHPSFARGRVRDPRRSPPRARPPARDGRPRRRTDRRGARDARRRRAHRPRGRGRGRDGLRPRRGDRGGEAADHRLPRARRPRRGSSCARSSETSAAASGSSRSRPRCRTRTPPAPPRRPRVAAANRR